MRRQLLPMLAAAAVGGCWLRRGLLKSMAMRGLIAVLPDPAKRHGIDMRFPIDRGSWTRYTLHADLSLALSGVLDHVVEAAAYSHYGGFKLNNVYSDFLNPDSPYYQAWIGAYVVLDNDRRKHFGFNDQGRPVGQEALDILEADQRMVYWACGCPNKFQDGRLVRQLGEWTVSEVDSGGERGGGWLVRRRRGLPITEARRPWGTGCTTGTTVSCRSMRLIRWTTCTR